MFLTDLLPTLFDGFVLRLTRRPLLPIERDAVLTALVNCVGESVMRRVRSGSELNASGEITQISTADHFSDDWTSRMEIVEAIERSSGLGRELSELALFLIETSLDKRLGSDGDSIVEIGMVHIAEPRPPTPEVDIVQRLLSELSSVTASQLDHFRLALPGWSAARERTQRQLETLQIVASFRAPLSYSIVLSDGLAYKKKVISRVDVVLEPPPESSARLRPA
ncbi:hypothetical protein [Bradyrhizobium sp. UFLA05-112]